MRSLLLVSLLQMQLPFLYVHFYTQSHYSLCLGLEPFFETSLFLFVSLRAFLSQRFPPSIAM